MGGNAKNGINLLNTAYYFPQVWSNLGFWGSIFILFLSILVIILTTNEYAFRTHRQNVIDGWNKLEFYHAKVLMVLVLSVAATVYLFLLGLLFGGINGHSLDGLFDEFSPVGYFLLLSLDYLGLALFIALAVRRSGLAIGLFLLYAMIIENILKGLIMHYADMSWGNLLLLQSSDELLPFPFTRMAKAILFKGKIFSDNIYVMVTIMWCVVYYVAGRLLLLRKDW